MGMIVYSFLWVMLRVYIINQISGPFQGLELWAVGLFGLRVWVVLF